MKAKYFNIKEFVSLNVYKKYGESAWRFIDEKLIITMDALRENLGRPIIINSYGRNLHQRGLRANKDEIVESKTGYYISQHCLGKASDFHVVGMTIREVYDHILNNRELYPYIKRIENISKTPTWIHIDVANTESNDINIF